MNKFLQTILIVIILTIFAVAAFSSTENQDRPQRIVSLGQSFTEALYALGSEDKIVGVTTFCNKPPEAQRKPKVASSISVDVEKILTLKPDLVIASPLIEPKSIKKLRQLGINVHTFPAPRNFEQLCEQYLELARLLGKEDDARVSIQNAREDIERTRAVITNKVKPSIVVQVGANPLWVAPQDSFINDFIEFAGGENAVPAGPGNYSREKIIQLDPDIIIVTTMGMAGAEEKENWMRYRELSAVKNGRVYIFDSDKICSATPESFAVTLKELAELIHNDEL
jgi:iron complex transport system substrate-binding protein